METLEVIAKRKSTRAYKPEQISEEALSAILKAACAAPVARAQYESLLITVVQNDDLLTRLFNEASALFLRIAGIEKNMNFGAKTLIVVSTTVSAQPEMSYANVGIVIENMTLAATDLGIDSVIMGAPTFAMAQNEVLKKELKIPEGFKPALALALGYGTDDEPPKHHDIKIERV